MAANRQQRANLPQCTAQGLAALGPNGCRAAVAERMRRGVRDDHVGVQWDVLPECCCSVGLVSERSPGGCCPVGMGRRVRGPKDREDGVGAGGTGQAD